MKTSPPDSDLGTLEEVDGRSVVRFERTYAHPIERVWAALTDPDELAHWYPTTIEGDLEAGPGAALRFEFRFEGIDGFDGHLDEYDPPRILAFHWGPDALRWELHPTAEGCRLEFTDSFSTIEKAARDSTGWHVCLAQLDDRLVGGSMPAPTDEMPDEWKGLFEVYADRYPPAASTLTEPD